MLVLWETLCETALEYLIPQIFFSKIDPIYNTFYINTRLMISLTLTLTLKFVLLFYCILYITLLFAVI